MIKTVLKYLWRADLLRSSWWKVLCVALLAFTIVGGLTLRVPPMNILNETIRNLYFHVPMWFGMILLFTASFVYALKYLRSTDPKHDIYSVELLKAGVFYSILGMLTGMEWANYTWGEPWSSDPKQISTAICMLTYFAYLILRGGLRDEEKRARISAIYNIFAYALMIPLLFVIPRLGEEKSLHPGATGNPAFAKYDLDNYMRLVFYPAIIAWTLLGFWFASLQIRLRLVAHREEHKDFDLEHTTTHDTQGRHG